MPSPSDEIFATQWLQPVIGLVLEHNFEEAFALAKYYPETSSRRLVQIASLLGRHAHILSTLELKRSKQAERALTDSELIAKSIKPEDRQQVRDFARLVNEIGPTLLQTSYEVAVKFGRFHLAHVCLEAIDVDAGDDNARAIEWLNLARECFTHGEFHLCEICLTHLAELQYDAAQVIQHFRGLSLSIGQQLLRTLFEKGPMLRQEEYLRLLAELLKTDLKLQKNQTEEIRTAIQDLPHELKTRIGVGLAQQEIFSLQSVCLDFARAEHVLQEALASTEQLAAVRVVSREIASESGEIQSVIDAVEQGLAVPPSKREELSLRIERIHALLYPSLRGLSAVQSVFHHLEHTLHLTATRYHDIDFEDEIYELQRLERQTGSYFSPELTKKSTGIVRSYKHVAEAIEHVQSEWISRLPGVLTNLMTDVKQTRIFLLEFSDQSQQRLQDPVSYEHILSEIPSAHRRAELVREAVVKLSTDSIEAHDQYLIPAISELHDFERPSSLSSSIQFSRSRVYSVSDYERDHMASQMQSASEIVAGRDYSYGSLEQLAASTPPLLREITRYTKILFPRSCAPDEKIELRIQLTRALPRITRYLSKLRLRVGVDIEEIKLIVVVTAPGFAIKDTQQPMMLPIDRDSEEVVFKLYAAETGDQIVEVEFFHENTRVGHVLIKTQVAHWPDRDLGENVSLLRDPVKSLQSKRGDQAGRKLVLHVTWMSRVGELRYKLPALAPGDEWTQPAPDLKSSIEDSLLDLNAFLTEAVSKGRVNQQIWDSIYLNLQGKGRYLFDNLVPHEVAELIRSSPRDSILAISTNEQWIPWELMFDSDDFWGRKYMLTRYPRSSDHTKWREAAAEHGDSRVIKKVLNVIGGGLQADDSARALQLFDSVATRVEINKLREKTVAELSNAVVSADVLHCTCHGLLDPHLLRISKDSSRIENLAPETVSVLPLQPGTLVFANACSSAGATLLFGTFNTFGWEFYLKGADAFIGTLGAVPTKYAIEFAEAVYAQLFNANQSVSLGQALRLAREDAEKKQNIFWLLYCVYGDPDYTVKFS